jgi:site-specific DNA recombinase
MKNAIIYTRVSSKEQVDEGHSLESQKRQCFDFAKKNDLNVLKHFEERGESAKTTDRPILKEMIQYVAGHAGEINALLLYKVDRLSRDTGDYIALKRLFEKAGIAIVSISKNFDDTPLGRVMETVASSFAQYDNEIRAERSKNGMVEAVRNGRWVWKAPIGYINTKVDGSSNIALDPRDDYCNALAAAWKLIDAGCSETEALRTINQRLHELNIPPIRIQTLSRMIRNKLYIGRIEVFGLSIQSRSIKPLIDEVTFWNVQDILTGNKNQGNKYVKINPLYPLRGILRDKNGHKLTGSSPRGNGGVYPKYHCPKCKGQKISYNVSAVDELFSQYTSHIKMKNDIRNALKEALRLNLGDSHQQAKKVADESNRRLKTIKIEKVELVQKNMVGIIPDQTARELLLEYEKEELDIRRKLNESNMEIEDAEVLLEFGIKKLSNLEDTFKTIEDPSVRFRFQKWLFPAGLTYDGEKFGTTRLPLILRVKQNTLAGALSDNSLLVIPRGIEPLLPG